MRERSTWNREQIKKAAQSKRADIYTMNQEHPQPSFDKYVTGDPSDFAEDVHSPNEWEKEYSGDEVKRDEIGLPEFRPDTWNHSEKTAKEVLVKKANLCVAVATMMLSGKKLASETAIEDQAVALMFLPDAALLDTHARLAAQQDDADEGDDSAEESQEKQAGEVPEAFKENIEKMKAKSEDKKDDDGEKKEAAEDKMPDFIKEKIEDKKEDDGEKKEAAQDGPKDVKNEGGDQNAKANDNWKTAAEQQMAQMQQMMAQLQQMMQQAQGQQMPQQQAPVMAQGDELDMMLADQSCGPMAEADIEMEPSPMDDMVLASDEDAILRDLFANDESEGQEEIEQAQQQDKQAKTRTASTRTVGTRPTAGVAKLGGTSKVAGQDSGVDSLSNLWKSAPDVRETFGLK